MTKLAYQLGVTGSVLGALAGLIELTIGAQIRPWIGNKENPAVLGVVTLLLSSIAFGAIISSRNVAAPTHDAKLAVFLGVFLPAVICFTTVGRLWYLPGSLLTTTALLLAHQYWFGVASVGAASNISSTGRLVAATGSLLILVSVGLGFWKSRFGLSQFEMQVAAERIRFETAPMDFLYTTNLSSGVTTVKSVEVSRVMYVYILLILGAAIALIASLTASRIFVGIGGGVVLTGLILFLIWLPAILAQAGPGYGFESFPGLIRSLSWGWYLSIIGTGLIFMTGLFRSQPG